LNNLIFFIVITTIGIFSSSFYLQQEIQAQTPDIVFKITNASFYSIDDHEFIIDINNIATNKEFCKSGNCSIEIIKFDEDGVNTSTTFLATPEARTKDVQVMSSGVDFRLHDTAYNNLSETERSSQERWHISGNCYIENIQDPAFTCEKGYSDTILLSNEVQGSHIILPLVHGKYDPESDILIFTANFN
jgi:hypothetical protein